ncbi:stage II sporulation protein D [Virgibacillus subterraneus]|uniref:Stage II sporulation protein D n=2 Tax=Virgibacillus TaxID=84406 RepID=A0A1H0YEE5_9BACI|nr:MULTISPECIES: stage II sporulation protein D [Virgibacillus]SDQ13595.1 stage II sporulation protein D [Virgibacillus salinus]SEP73850.1 stage II sporulation protein D [Virgibacillus subterraneus]
MKKNKNLPKAWKKKKQRKSETLKLQLLQKRKKPLNLNKTPTSWKVPSILFFASLITIILVIPTLVVVPFVAKDGEKNVTIENDTPEQVEITMGKSPFSVAVMRANSDTVEDVPLETYVSRVVASEMPAKFEVEALKAQALAARTFIVNHLMQQGNSDASDVTDTIYDQVYHNEKELREEWGSDYSWKINKIKKAVSETSGEILTYNNAPIQIAFFSTSNGYTENSEDYWENEVPYLRSVKSPWDKNSPKFLDQKIFTMQEVESLLGVDLPNNDKLTMEITRTESNRVDKLKIADQTYSGRKIREELELKSSDFSIEQKNNHLIFKTKGFGHGIGMSQYGANGMAKEGKNYKEIVKYYYKGIEVNPLDETVPTLVAK